MSAIKGILGFLVGLIACGILLFLMSVRSPMSEVKGTNTTPAQASTSEAASGAATDSGAQEPLINEPDSEQMTAPATDAASDPVSEAEPTIDMSDDAQTPATDAPTDGSDTAPTSGADDADQTMLQTPSGDAATPNPVLDAVIDTFTPKPDTAEVPAVTPEPQAEPGEVKLGTKFQNPTVTTMKTVGTLGSSSGFKSTNTPNKTETESATPAMRAFDKNAQSYAEPQGPVLSVILVYSGANGMKRTELLNADFPVTIAVNPDSDDAVRAASDFYNAGFETLIQNPLQGDPLTEERDDMAVAARLEQFIANVPTAVGMVDNGAGKLRKTRAARLAVMDVFAQTGHALLSTGRGINNIPREAEKRQVKSAPVFRILDGNGESSETIATYLSRTVLQANQDGSAIVMGTATKTTFDAVQKWLQSAQAASVTIAPVSAAILANKR